MRNSGKIALGGLISALCLVCMFLTGLIPFATIALPAIAGVLLIVVVIELGKRWALLVYAAVSLLSILLTADMEAKLLFILFFGYYPILKAVVEKMSNRLLQWTCKLAVFNAAAIGAYLLAVFVFSLPVQLELFGVSIPLVLLLAGNVVFVIYDYAVTALTSVYVLQFQSKIHKRLKFF